MVAVRCRCGTSMPVNRSVGLLPTLLPLTLLTSLLLAGCRTTNATEGASVGVSPRAAAMVDLQLERIDGTTVDLAAFRGRAVLVVAFMHDDLRSQATLREIEHVARRHRQSLVVIGVCGNEGPVSQQRMMLEVFSNVIEVSAMQLTFANASVRDGTSPLGVIEHVPTTVLINRAGYVARTVVGAMNEQAVEALIRPALPPGG